MPRDRPAFLQLILLAAILSRPSLLAYAFDDPSLVWSFDEGQGTIAHGTSSSGLDGIVLGPAWTRGVVGSGLLFDGIDDHVDITSESGLFDPVATLEQGTISVWFRFHSAPVGADIHPLFYFGDGVGGEGHSALLIEVGHFQDNRRLYFTVHEDYWIPTLCFESGFDLDVGVWYHFAAVVGPHFNTGYLNGEELVERPYNFGTRRQSRFFRNVDNRVFWVGCAVQGSERKYYFDGVIDELRIYDRPLSAAEIRSYYESVFEPPVFRRGDCDGDGRVDISDGTCGLIWLFGGRATPSCLAALNSNGDSRIDITDSLFLLSFLFRGGPLPIDPFPECGAGTLTADRVLGCESQPDC